ncbi:uncharacterized protein LOC111682265 [Lucilia cuprina]|uniref:uncharacterized protein LOC111682265 n=1 Tax=Lucilia cuprina TaxID=7375 RepID=UPI001F053FA6|nr:uncharacterized protein LOC111682265 [Lucilia cuprina]
MLHSITVITKSFICSMLLLVLLMTSMTLVESKALMKTNSLQTQNTNDQNIDNISRQFLFLKGVGRETSTPDFIRLVVMRFIYGLASTMGVEERLEGIFNGAFVPPNADGDIFGFGGDGGDGEDFDEAALESIFADDAF